MRKIIFAVCITLFLAACGGRGEEFIGKWYDVDSKIGIRVDRNGNDFLIKIVTPGLFGTPGVVTKPALLQGDQLVFDGGFGQVHLAIDKKTGLLLDGKHQYKRVQSGEIEASEAKLPKATLPITPKVIDLSK